MNNNSTINRKEVLKINELITMKLIYQLKYELKSVDNNSTINKYILKSVK